MPFGMVSVVGLCMGVLDFGGDHRREGTVLGVNLGRLCDALFSDYFEDLFHNS